MGLSILLLIIGFVLIILGADFLTDGASSLAKRNKVSELTIGLTIVAFGTSAPELAVNLVAATRGYDNVSMGNIIGSNIFNLLLILGISGLIYPVVVQSKTVWKEIPFSFLAGMVLLLLANDSFFRHSAANRISRSDGLLLLLFFTFFLYYAFSHMRDEKKSSSGEFKVYKVPKTILMIVLGFVFLIIGGKLVVNRAVDLAKILGVSDKIISLTIIASGTSLPELATSAVAAYKKRSDLAIGNVIGSNIFNLLFILGITSLVRPVQYSLSFTPDLFIYLIATLFVFIAMFTGKKGRLDRWESAVLLTGYIAYLAFLIHQNT